MNSVISGCAVRLIAFYKTCLIVIISTSFSTGGKYEKVINKTSTVAGYYVIVIGIWFNVNKQNVSLVIF